MNQAFVQGCKGLVFVEEIVLSAFRFARRQIWAMDNQKTGNGDKGREDERSLYMSENSRVQKLPWVTSRQGVISWSGQ